MPYQTNSDLFNVNVTSILFIRDFVILNVIFRYMLQIIVYIALCVATYSQHDRNILNDNIKYESDMRPFERIHVHVNIQSDAATNRKPLYCKSL